MRLILNVIWLIFGGLWLALGYLLAALICFVLIITIPFGFAALRIAVYALWPFGRTIVDKPGVRPGCADRQHRLARRRRSVAGDRPCRQRGRDGDHDRGDPAGAGQPQDDPGLTDAPRQGDRAGRHLRSAGNRSSAVTAVALGVPSVRRPASPAPAEGPLIDTFGRVATDLRVSLTDLCNLRCTYCMPAEGLDWLPGEQKLRPDELVRLLDIAVTRLGITSVRFTGGEPLVVPHLEEVIAATAALHPRPEITLTTNGVGLARRAQRLKDAGLDRINVSLDTVDAARFAAITRRDRLSDVVGGPAGRSGGGTAAGQGERGTRPGVRTRRRGGVVAVLPGQRLSVAHHRADALGRRPRVAARARRRGRRRPGDFAQRISP